MQNNQLTALKVDIDKVLWNAERETGVELSAEELKILAGSVRQFQSHSGVATWNMVDVVYLIGPYRGEIELNKRAADSVAVWLWTSCGKTTLVPHRNGGGLESRVPEDILMLGHVELMQRCDAVVLMPGWNSSEGSKAEIALAIRANMPLFLAPGAATPNTKSYQLDEDGEVSKTSDMLGKE